MHDRRMNAPLHHAPATVLHCGRCHHQLAPCTAFGLVVVGGTIRHTVGIGYRLSLEQKPGIEGFILL